MSDAPMSMNNRRPVGCRGSAVQSMPSPYRVPPAAPRSHPAVPQSSKPRRDAVPASTASISEVERKSQPR